jgi:ABC-2 type transport system ATP-binding protein
VREPACIMLDEPMTGLDPRGIRTMKDSIREQAKAGIGVMLSSHLLALVEDLCDALLIMHLGKLVFFGSVGDARVKFGTGGSDASLEEVFFRATESAEGARAPATTPAVWAGATGGATGDAGASA